MEERPARGDVPKSAKGLLREGVLGMEVGAGVSDEERPKKGLGMEPGLVAVGNVPERKRRSSRILNKSMPTGCFSVWHGCHGFDIRRMAGNSDMSHNGQVCTSAPL